MSKSFFISTPIYYVNARPHLGHAYTSLMADTLKRFHMMLGEDTWFLTGTDEHGDKIVQAAEKLGKDPQSFVDEISAEFQAILPKLNVQNDQFIRTSDPLHKEAVQAFLQKLYDAGAIYFGEYGGHYCYGCERFYTEKELENGLCPQHQTKPSYISEKNYFFKMSAYQEWLKEYIVANPDFIRPERYKQEVLAMLEGEVLEDLCISRPKSRLSWGIELPFDKDFVSYVWFDALLNYITALGWQDNSAKFQKYWAGAEHLIAKDILKPHAIFWPTMLKAAELPMFKHLNVHGYWLVRDTKMSKSLGNVVDPIVLSEKYGQDSFRYFLLKDMNFGSDASFSEENLISRINADLANDLGNLFSRVLSMNSKYFEGNLPSEYSLNAEDKVLCALAENAMQNYLTLFENMKISQALEALWEFIRALNKYVDSQAPWTLYKNNDLARLSSVIRLLLESLYKCASLLTPVLPNISKQMIEQLGQKEPTLNSVINSWSILQEAKLATSSNLFPRIELPKLEEEKTKKSAPKEEKATKTVEKNSEIKELIEYTDFQKLELKVGTVIEVSKHPSADKLLCFKIDLGEAEPRQIISGIAEHFEPSDLIGMQLCIVSNLAPRKIRGLESQGMILTAEASKQLSLLTVSAKIANGSKIS